MSRLTDKKMLHGWTKRIADDMAAHNVPVHEVVEFWESLPMMEVIDTVKIGGRGGSDV